MKHVCTNKKCRLLKIEDERIIFEGGHCLSFDHEQDCCENNYADFSVFEDYVGKFFVNADKVQIRFVDGSGFLLEGFMDDLICSYQWPIFVPCYSEQNGYYTTDISIYWDGKKIGEGTCIELFGY